MAARSVEFSPFLDAVVLLTLCRSQFLRAAGLLGCNICIYGLQFHTVFSYFYYEYGYVHSFVIRKSISVFSILIKIDKLKSIV